MHILQSRRDFLTSLSAAGAAGVLGARDRSPTRGRRRRPRSGYPRDPSICIAPEQIADDLLRAEGFTDVRYVQVSHTRRCRRSGEVDFGSETAAWVVSHLDAGQPITALGRDACRLLRAVRARARPQPSATSRASGSASHSARLERASAACGHGGAGRARSAHRHQLGHAVQRRPHGAVRPRRGRRLSRLSARAAGAARPQDRSRDPQHRRRTSRGRNTSAA